MARRAVRQRSRLGPGGSGTGAGSWRGPGRRRRPLVRSRAGPSPLRAGEEVRVDGLAALGRTRPDMAPRAAVGRARWGAGDVALEARVALHAEVGLLHGAEAEAVLVVVAGRAQAATQVARGRVTHEATPLVRGRDEPRRAEGDSRAPVVESARLAIGEVQAGDGLLV